MTRRFLVLYGTTDGQTAKIAASVAETLRTQGIEVDLVDAATGRAATPEPYAAVVVAASVHAGGYQRSVRRWVKAHAADLETKPTAFISVCLGVLEGSLKTDQELSRIAKDFSTATGWKATVFKIVAGALPYTKYNWLKRRMMRRIVAKAHGDTDTTRDYEYTDWNDLRAFAVDLGHRFAEAEGKAVAV